MSPTGEQARCAAGFTLLELLAVLGILALVLAVALPMLPGAADRMALRTAATEVASGLRETRSAALSGGRSAVFTLDTARRAYRIAGSPTWRALPASVDTVLLTATGERIDDVTGDIRFFPDGSSTGGAVRLAQGKARDEIAVDWLTGRVSAMPLAGAAAR